MIDLSKVYKAITELEADETIKEKMMRAVDGCLAEINSTHKEFADFLRSENVYHEYIENFKDHRAVNDDINLFLRLTHKNDYFACAFTWLESKEGTVFWSNINKKWREVCTH